MKIVQVQLRGFSDASERAFAGIVYVRTVYEDGVIVVRLVSAKSKVCPMKQQTIPRLELLSANILAHYWTDSSAVLCWIRNEKSKQYVNQRVKEIRNLTDKESWNHCPGAMNPADLPSRGIRVDEMVSNPLWWNGPAFLQQPEEEWPNLGYQEEIDKAAENEVVKQPKTVTRILVGAVSSQIPDVASVIDCDRFSDKLKLPRVTAYVNRFISLLKSSVKGTNEQVIADGLNLSEAEILK